MANIQVQLSKDTLRQEQRHQFVASIADNILFTHASSGSQTESFALRLRLQGKR